MRISAWLDDALEENYMTVYVKTINGKTISTKMRQKTESSYYVG